jgi:hypothetical protein
VLDDVTLAVLVPFAEKLGGTLNGYLIGRYPFETFGGERPTGFIEVLPSTARLQVSRHLRFEDFLTHDHQLQWPRYVALSPELLDKVELVAAEIARTRGVPDPVRVQLNVHSGFRTPLHNGNVEGSAFNSRHQYGDAADVAFDADGDGRFTALDAQWAGLAPRWSSGGTRTSWAASACTRARAPVRAHRRARAAGAVVEALASPSARPRRTRRRRASGGADRRPRWRW